MSLKMRIVQGGQLAGLLTLLLCVPSHARAESVACGMAGYKPSPGMTATVADDLLTVTWQGDKDEEVRLRFVVRDGTPTMQEIAVRGKGAAWADLASNVTPEFSFASGIRRIDSEAAEGLKENGMAPITPEIYEKYKWDPFWDAPLNVPGTENNGSQRTVYPSLPRKPEEIRRGIATYHAQSCEVKTDGTRLAVSFPGVDMGIFSGELQYTMYRGTNLIRQELIAKTESPSIAYRYDAGLKGLTIGNGARLIWNDLAGSSQVNQFGGSKNDNEAPLKTNNRLLIAEMGQAGSIATFPPPHTFFWARESDATLGYNWYRKDSDSSFSFGVRQPDDEEDPRDKGNFALYSGRPGTLQHMAVYFYISPAPAAATRNAVLAFTHDDHYKPLPGYKVMGHHYHMSFGLRLIAGGGPDTEIPDLEGLKSVGINIVSPVDNVGTGGGAGNRSAADTLKMIASSAAGARQHSDKDFLVMPDEEFYGSVFGGHTDLLFSHPVFWTYGRADGQPLVENDAKYGKVYHIGSADDLFTMVKREDILMSLPHPRTKNNAGYPDGFKDKDFFRDAHFQSIGFRWGMGLDLSERRLCEYRCLPLEDDLLNWYADDPTPPKYLLGISEVQTQTYGDGIYSSEPVNYLKMNIVPSANDPSPVIKTLMRGDYFVTSGEVLIPSYSLQGSGPKRTIVADVEWTFPLDFVEVVWGDGQHTDRQIISTTDLPAFGQHRFTIPFDATGKKWVRFAAWDSAGDGALVQPIKLTNMGSK
jgi:hypothetical protein